MPLSANLTAAQQTQIQTEGSSLGNTLNDARLANIDGLAQLRTAAGALANPASSREDLIEAGSFLKGYVNGVRAIARQAGLNFDHEAFAGHQNTRAVLGNLRPFVLGFQHRPGGHRP